LPSKANGGLRPRTELTAPERHWSSLLAISFYTYFGTSLLAPTASFVLPRDPSGRSLIRGSIAGSLGMIVEVMVWLSLVSRAVPRESLQTMKGTVLVALGNTGIHG
jgi:hypothetical protein